MAKKKLKGRGGAGRGQGRKRSPDSKVNCPLRMAPDIVEYLRWTEEITATAESAIRGTKAFRQWKKANA